jgi:hypothetical protein
VYSSNALKPRCFAYGRSRRGTRVHDHAPHHHWQIGTFVAALRITGLTAPGLLDGPMDGDCLLAYLDQILVPTFHAGDIVVMDNLASHHVEGVRERIDATGATLVLAAAQSRFESHRAVVRKTESAPAHGPSTHG